MGITDFTIDGQCTSCGACCSGVLPLSRMEIARIKHYLTRYPVKEQRRNGLVGVDMTCPFRDERERKCLIYPVRPDICAEFMCNYTPEDIKRAKMDFHKERAAVFMREEFFGNHESRQYVDEVTAALFRMANGGFTE